MVIGFVGGIMDLLWMGGATLLMTLEKLPDIGKHLTKPLGFGLILWGIATLAV
jgi:predicted metal-binding membrane protein